MHERWKNRVQHRLVNGIIKSCCSHKHRPFLTLLKNRPENTHDEQTEYIDMLADEDMVIDSNLMDEKHGDKKDANSRSFPSK